MGVHLGSMTQSTNELNFSVWDLLIANVAIATTFQSESS